MQRPGRRSVFDALYERYKSHYLYVVLGGLSVAACFVAIPLWAAIDARPATRHVADPWMVAGASGLGIVVGLPAIWVIFGLRHRAISRWLAGRPGASAIAAWESAVRMPATVVMLLVWLWVTISLPMHILGAARSDLSGRGTIVSWGASAFVLLGMGVFFILALEAALRPAVLDMAGHAVGARPRGWLDLRRRLLVVSGAIAIFTGATVGSLTVGHGDHREEELFRMFVATCGAAVTITGALTLMLRHSLVSRLDGLRAALEDVRSGHLTRRVRATVGDELDEVGAAFNEMTERLAAHDREMRSARERLASATVTERKRIERDLHDGVQQYMALLRLQLTRIERHAINDPVKVAGLATEALATVADAARELQSLARGIYPAVLADNGLAAALSDAAARAAIPTNVSADDIGRMDPGRETAVYFCCLEALQNAAKHAGEGATATVSLALDDGRLVFSVADDGVGFDSADRGHGFTSMRDRIGAFGGDTKVTSRVGTGTVVSGWLPVEAALH